jgi:sulfur-carrier protein adenylyltransferase/sulfurtransferase
MNDILFDSQELSRYSRQLSLLGVDGQARLKRAKVLCVGAGGLAAPALTYLAAVGIGRIGVIDADSIELSNLNRQVLFGESQIDHAKVVCAKEYLSRLNSSVEVQDYEQRLTTENADELVRDYDVIIDATDNYRTRYLLNEFSRKHQKPLVSASIYQFDAQISVFNYQQGPCYQCLYPQVPKADLLPNCADAGVIGVLPGIVGSLQAAEVIKIVTQLGDVLSGVLLKFNLLTLKFSRFEIRKHPQCSQDGCVNSLNVATKEDISQPEDKVLQLSPQQLAQWLKNKTELTLVDVRQPYEREICHIGGVLIPYQQLEDHLDQIPLNKKLVIYCKSGVRSHYAAQILIDHGYQRVYNLDGGILNWIEQVQPELSKY